MEEPETSDTENNTKHEEFVENVLSLTKPPRIKKPSRTEPTVKVSEYDLVRSITGTKGAVHVHDLTSVLRHKTNHVELGKKIKKTEKKAKTLPKPLEKPQAEKIKRAVGYEKTKQELDKWEAVVTANRASLNLQFPLETNLNFSEENDKSKYEFRIKSDLQKKLEEIDNKYEVVVVEPKLDKKFPMTLREIMKRREEAAKMRAHQSYKEAKARRQNKIKSKKYHRIQKREKMKQQMKEFELLQRSDPEAALKKLEDIEKARIEERFSLRHKSTGQWARNKQIRAKYDKESRQVLAQQLSINRDLTQKIKKVDEDSDSDNEEQQEKNVKPPDPNNPWVGKIEPDEEVGSFVNSYKKFWEEQNKQKETARNECNKDNENVEASKGESETEISKEEKKQETIPRKKEKSNNEARSKSLKRKSKEAPKNNKKKKINGSAEWKVTSIDDETALENIFDDLEQEIEKTVREKAQKIIEKSTDGNTVKKSKEKQPKRTQKAKKIDLSIPRKVTKPIIDEELLENTENEAEETSKELEVLQNILNATSQPQAKKIVAAEKTNSDKVINAKPVSLNTVIPELLTIDENEEEDDEDNMAGIAAAFEDSDVIEEFDKEKAAEIEKSKPKDIDLTLPGWGCWGGKDLKVPDRKRRAFIVKFPKKAKRRDMNKGRLIINEDGNDKARQHMVSEIPFPFKTVKDFEASIRAPIGNTFVPEIPHRRMILPPVRTKMGTIIEPMSEEVLLKKTSMELPIIK